MIRLVKFASFITKSFKSLSISSLINHNLVDPNFIIAILSLRSTNKYIPTAVTNALIINKLILFKDFGIRFIFTAYKSLLTSKEFLYHKKSFLKDENFSVIKHCEKTKSKFTSIMNLDLS
jgi:hypothetical protein